MIATSLQLTREINILNEATSDRASKKGALDKISKEIKGLKEVGPQIQLAASQLIRPLMKALVDPIEKCRELSMAVIQEIVERIENVNPLLPELVPLFNTRLGQQKVVVEGSEEIRLSMIKTLNRLVSRSGPSFNPFVQDAVSILGPTTLDTFQDIRKEAFHLITTLCKYTPQSLALHGGTIVKLILPSLSHRHSSVRTGAMQALIPAMIVDASAIDDSIEPLRILTRDKAPIVREQLYTLTHDWLSLLMDRHVYGVKILPLLYAGLTDELPKLVDVCLVYMDQIGAQYERENNDRIKDELDYTDGVDRPNRPRIGSRHLARDNIQKIMGKQIELLGDWNLDTRLKAAQVLTVFMNYAENNATGYIGVLLPAVYKVLAGDEPQVMDQTIKLMETIGVFVKPNTTLTLILPALSSGGSGLSTFRMGCLRALQGVLKGTPSENLAPHLKEILSALSERDLLQNENITVMIEVAKALQYLGAKLTLDRQILFSYFMILLQLESFPGHEKVIGWPELQATVKQAFTEHAGFLSISLVDIYTSHMDEALVLLSQSYSSWTQYSPEPRIFQTLLFKCGPKFAEKLDPVLTIVTACVALEKDFDLREVMLKTLVHLFKSFPVDSETLKPFVFRILKDIVMKACIWRAGRKATIVRNLGTLLFLHIIILLEPGEASPLLKPLFDSDILPVITSNLDDDEQTTRQNCLDILTFLVKCQGLWSIEAFKKLYPELLKRMDDAKDIIRIHSSQVWELLFPCFTACLMSLESIRVQLPLDEQKNLSVMYQGALLDLGLDSGHYETILDGLLLHMDDVNPLVQEAVFKALIAAKESSFFDPSLFGERVKVASSKHRSDIYLNKLC